MTGWCPIHDRVYDADDGLCPRCGTALVADDAPAEKPVVIEQTTEIRTEEAELPASGPDGPRRTSTIVGIAAAIVIAFVAGLAFPKAEREPSPSTLREATSDLSIGVTRTSAGVPLRLESFTQRGKNIVARFTVGQADGLDLGRLRSAAATIIIGGGGEISFEFQPRTTISGFILDGEIPSDTTPVLGLRIEALTLEVGAGADVPIDLTGVWPATLANQPRARRATGTLEVGDGRTFELRGLVGWEDRLEIGLAIIGARAGWDYATEFALVSQSTHRGTVSRGATTSTVRFDSLPRARQDWAFRVSVATMSALGPWEWSFV